MAENIIKGRKYRVLTGDNTWTRYSFWTHSDDLMMPVGNTGNVSSSTDRIGSIMGVANADSNYELVNYDSTQRWLADAPGVVNYVDQRIGSGVHFRVNDDGNLEWSDGEDQGADTWRPFSGEQEILDFYTGSAYGNKSTPDTWGHAILSHEYTFDKKYNDIYLILDATTRFYMAPSGVVMAFKIKAYYDGNLIDPIDGVDNKTDTRMGSLISRGYAIYHLSNVEKNKILSFDMDQSYYIPASEPSGNYSQYIPTVYGFSTIMGS